MYFVCLNEGSASTNEVISLARKVGGFRTEDSDVESSFFKEIESHLPPHPHPES